MHGIDAQAEMDRRLGVKEHRTTAERASRSAAKPGRNAVYSQALAEAQTLYPNDGVAAHRVAMRAADRATRMHPGSTPTEEARKQIDAALLAAFPEDTGERGRLSIVKEFPDHIIARGADGELYRIDYTMKDGGGVTFGTPEEIEEGPEDEPEGSGGPKN
jgi:hypothetical protein